MIYSWLENVLSGFPARKFFRPYVAISAKSRKSGEQFFFKSKLLTSGDNHFKEDGLVLWIETGTIGLVKEKIYDGIIWAAALETL